MSCLLRSDDARSIDSLKAMFSLFDYANVSPEVALNTRNAASEDDVRGFVRSSVVRCPQECVRGSLNQKVITRTGSGNGG